jgi:APA family basic amino acid/polyamine antiporter
LHFNDLWGIILRKREPNAEKALSLALFIRFATIIVTTAICITLLVYDTLNTGLGLGVALEYRVLFSNG